jgi:hypothetical protein
MRLSFPNPCRSYDAGKSRVCFWGYDNTIEITFFIEADALKQLCPEMSGVESGFLQAFDAALRRIHEVADKLYVRGHNVSCAYILAAKDF